MKRTKKITKKFEQRYCVRAQPNTAQAYTLHYKLHIHENDHFNFATTDYVDGTDYIKADLHFLFLKQINQIERIFFIISGSMSQKYF